MTPTVTIAVSRGCLFSMSSGVEAAVARDPLGNENYQRMLHLLTNGTEAEDAVFHKLYDHFLKTFDFKNYAKSLAMLETGLQRSKEEPTAYALSLIHI